MTTEVIPELAWWVKHRAAVKKALGVSRLMLRPSPDGVDFEWYREGDPYEYRTEEIETLKRELAEPAPPRYSPPKVQTVMTIRASKRLGPNDRCSCGSGRKFKKCCGR